MGEARNFIVMIILYLAIVLGLIQLIFSLTRKSFIIEFLFLLGIAFFIIIAMTGIYYNARWGWILSSLILAVILINQLLIYLRTSSIGAAYLLTTLLTAVAFVVSVSMIREEESKEPEPIEEKIEPPEEPEPVYTNFEPGKFIASKTGTTYHTPKCDWAKKIHERNRLWLEDEKEARRQGYKKHSCLE